MTGMGRPGSCSGPFLVLPGRPLSMTSGASDGSISRGVAPYAAATTARARSSTLGPPSRGGSGTGTTVVVAGRLWAAASTARTSASGRTTTSAGPATSGSRSNRAFIWSARWRSCPIWRRCSAPRVTAASTGPSPALASSARTSAGRRRHRRNGPCSRPRTPPAGLGRRAVAVPAADGPLLGDLQDGQRGALLVLQDQVAAARRYHLFRYLQGDRDRPRRAVGQRPALGRRGQVG